MGSSLEDLEILQGVESISNQIWEIVKKWQPFEKDTVGKQLIRAIDSVGANIAESFGRFHYGEKINFLYYSRGSLFETKYWLNQCHTRRLISASEYKQFREEITLLAKQLNNFISYLKSKRYSNNKLGEPAPQYLASDNINDNHSNWLQSTNPQSLVNQSTNYQLPPKGRNHGTSS